MDPTEKRKAIVFFSVWLAGTVYLCFLIAQLIREIPNATAAMAAKVQGYLDEAGK
jgi:threonine/homoserine/homoserine lactone efflux protein